MHRLQNHDFVQRAQAAEVFPPLESHLCDADHPRFFQHGFQQCKWLHSQLLRLEVMAVAVIYSIDFFCFYEAGDIDAVCGCHRNFIKIRIIKNYILIFTIFIPPDSFRDAEIFFIFCAIKHLFGPGVALLM